MLRQREVLACGAVDAVQTNSGYALATKNSVDIYGRDRVLETRLQFQNAQLAYLSDSNTIAICTNGSCTAVHLGTRKRTLQVQTSSAHSIAAAKNVLVVASKRKIRWYAWSRGLSPKETTLSFKKSIGPVAISEDAQTIFGLIGDEFHLIDTLNRRVVALPLWASTSFFSSSKPLVTAVQKHFLVVSTTRGTIINSSSKVTATINWDVAPSAVSFVGPFLAVLLEETLELRDPQNGHIITSIEIAESESLSNGLLLSSSHLKELELSISIEDIQEIAKTKPAVAGSLIEQLPHLSGEEALQLRADYAKSAFESGRYQEALQTFSETKTDVSFVTALINKILDDMADSAAQTPSDQASTFSMISRKSARKNPTLEDFVNYLTKERRRRAIDAAKQKEVDPKDLTCIDTALFRCYLKSKSSLIAPLLRLGNQCDPAVVGPALLQSGKWKELVSFLRARHMHREAIKVLKDQNQEEKVLPYLKTLPCSQFEIVREFVQPLLDQDVSKVREMFLDTNEFDPIEVYNFVVDKAPKLGGEYLEYCIRTCSNSSKEVHNAYAFWCINIKEQKALETFLQSSNIYSVQRVLSRVPDTWISCRAILMGKLQRHLEALDLFIEAGKLEEAEKYTISLFEHDEDKGTSALAALLPRISQGDLDNMAQFLHRHIHRLSLSMTLSHIQDSMNSKDVVDVIVGQACSLVEQANSSDLYTSLQRVSLLETSSDLTSLTQQSSRIDQFSTCALCQKILGMSVVGVSPGSRVYHYGCLNSR